MERFVGEALRVLSRPVCAEVLVFCVCAVIVIPPLFFVKKSRYCNIVGQFLKRGSWRRAKQAYLSLLGERAGTRNVSVLSGAEDEQSAEVVLPAISVAFFFATEERSEDFQ